MYIHFLRFEGIYSIPLFQSVKINNTVLVCLRHLPTSNQHSHQHPIQQATSYHPIEGSRRSVNLFYSIKYCIIIILLLLLFNNKIQRRENSY